MGVHGVLVKVKLVAPNFRGGFFVMDLLWLVFETFHSIFATECHSLPFRRFLFKSSGLFGAGR